MYHSGNSCHGQLTRLKQLSMVAMACRVRMGHGKPGKSWNFRISFSRPGKSWNLGVGDGKSWKMMFIKKHKINWVCLRRK